MSIERVLTDEELDEIKEGDIKIEDEVQKGKETNRVANDIEKPDYWMPFNEGYGIHDIDWNSSYDMRDNHSSELTEKELENSYGGPIKAEDLPNKFKQVKKDEAELSEDSLESVYGGPIKAEDLPEEFYTDKNEDIMRR